MGALRNGFELSYGSAMKAILIPTEDHDAMPAVLEAARLVAQTFDSYMEGFAVHPAAGTYVAVEPVSSLAISGAFEHDAELAAQARTLFETYMQKNQVPAATPGTMACDRASPINDQPLSVTKQESIAQTPPMKALTSMAFTMYS